MSTETAVHPRTQPPTSMQRASGMSRSTSTDMAPRRATRSAEGWTLLVGAIIGLALVKEILTRIGGNPVIRRPPSLSRASGAFSIAVLFGMLKRIGVRAAGI